MMQFRAMPKLWNYMYTTYSICSVYRSNIFILRLGNGDGDSCEGHLTAAPNLFWRVHRTRDSLLMCICMCCLSFSHVFILQKTNGHVFFLSPCLLMSLLAACVVGCMKRISRAWYAETEKKNTHDQWVCLLCGCETICICHAFGHCPSFSHFPSLMPVGKIGRTDCWSNVQTYQIHTNTVGTLRLFHVRNEFSLIWYTYWHGCTFAMALMVKRKKWELHHNGSPRWFDVDIWKRYYYFSLYVIWNGLWI